jgi:DNA-binding LacI/PurR family transcriptional regulator
MDTEFPQDPIPAALPPPAPPAAVSGRPTVSDVAKRAGVSIYTIHNFFARPQLVAESTRQKIETAVTELGYIPNSMGQALRSGRTKTIGLLLLAHRLKGSFSFETLSGILRELETHGYDLLISPVHSGGTPVSVARQIVSGGRCDAVLAHLENPDEECLRGLKALNVPVVLLYQDPSGKEEGKLTGVNFDNGQGIDLIVRHVAGLGHQRIAYLGGTPGWPQTGMREAAFRSTMSALNLKVADPWIIPTDFANPEVSVNQTIENLWKTSGPKPTAIVCASDWIAAAAIKALRLNGLSIPHDVSITGFDNGDLCDALDPPLTTISLPTEETGRSAARLVCANLDNGEFPSVEKVACGLVIRKSTAPPA